MERATLVLPSLLVGASTIWYASTYRGWLELSSAGIEGPGKHRDPRPEASTGPRHATGSQPA